MERYKVVDIYEGRDTIGYTSNMNTVKKLARQRADDTDGECLIEIRELDAEVNKYRFFKILESC